MLEVESEGFVCGGAYVCKRVQISDDQMQWPHFFVWLLGDLGATSHWGGGFEDLRNQCGRFHLFFNPCIGDSLFCYCF